MFFLMNRKKLSYHLKTDHKQMNIFLILNFEVLRKIIFTSVFSFLFLSCALADKGHKIEVTVAGVQDTTAFLAYHYGNRQYVQDTVFIDSKGHFIFQGEEALPKGIYMVVLPGQIYFEILVDHNQHFSIKTKNDEFVNSTTFNNSPDNEAFYGYMRFIREQSEASVPLRTELQAPETSEGRKEQIRKILADTDEKVKQEQNRIIQKFPDGIFSKILLAQQDPPLPETRLKDDGSTDHELMYQLYKSSFWNNIDLTDDRLVRTPIFHARLNQFFTKVVIQIPDSIIKEADHLLAQLSNTKEAFKYAVFFITNTFERSQIMGMDAVFVHMVEEYYMSGRADWVTQEQLQSISERAMALKPILLGKVAPDLTMFAPDRKPLSLHKVNAKFTVLYFWDSECSHCKQNTPKLVEFYDRMKAKDVEIFAVNTEADREKWLAYTNQKFRNWINVNDPTNSSGFRDKYDIWATPLIFLLDKDKKILAKKITVEQLEDIINLELGKN
jgi:peroxiredoxin